ncbi:hypothetical protein CBR_g3861 [Chara braunii]|uniref:Protein kinase domain-containing protein n=1 Tax=Chara braunii TaxID=69332 RepID=A0A388KGI8_CHABU|nr:hypothetical protein CBR_g3861 [Chara braunii]|eukprot:GBG69161.1 hypothetical protein CBR_g3861 [Chara braunii]
MFCHGKRRHVCSFAWMRFFLSCLLAIAAAVCGCCLLLAPSAEKEVHRTALRRAASHASGHASARFLQESASASQPPLSPASGAPAALPPATATPAAPSRANADPGTQPDYGLLPLRPNFMLKGSVRLVRSHPPRADSSADEECHSEIKNLVISPLHVLYYVLEQYCSKDGSDTHREVSIRNVSLLQGRASDDSMSPHTDEGTVSYMWPFDQPNGSRIANGTDSGVTESLPYVSGMGLSRDGAHLLLSVRRFKELLYGNGFHAENLSMLISVSLSDGSRSSIWQRYFVTSLAVDNTSILVNTVYQRDFYSINSIEVDDSGRPMWGTKPGEDFLAKSELDVVFQSQSVVANGTCLYYAQMPGGEVWGQISVKTNLYFPERSRILDGGQRANDIVATPDGCNVFVARGKGIQLDVFPVNLPCKGPKAERTRSGIIYHAEFTGLALHDDGKLLSLYIGTSNGNLFRVPLHRSDLHICKRGRMSAIPFVGLMLIVSVTAGFVVLGIAAGLKFMFNPCKTHSPRAREANLESQRPTTDCTPFDISGLKPSRLKRFPLQMLLDCTGNFSDSLRIGERGAFGKVYRGSVDGMEVAMKVMTGELTDTKRSQFVAEVNTLSAVNHVNLIQLIGYCLEGSHCILVYPFFRGGCLHRRLFPNVGKGTGQTSLVEEHTESLPPLTLQERMSVAFQIAKGLCYLHDGAKPPIIHRDIKSSNVLLGDGCGETLHVVLADFGLAAIGERVLDTGHDHIVLTSHIGGTFGYMSPEYMLRGELSEKNDVYSFGVLVLELLTGRKVAAPAPSGVGWETLVEWVKPFLRGGGENIQDQDRTVDMPYAILDPWLRDQAEGDSMKHLVMSTIQLAWECVHEEYGARPAMRTVIQGFHSMFLEVGWESLTKTTDMANLFDESRAEDDVRVEDDRASQADWDLLSERGKKLRLQNHRMRPFQMQTKV